MRIGKFAKAPGDRKKYTVDYSQWLDNQELITDVQSFVPDDEFGIYVDGLLVSTDGKSLDMFVSGGQESVSYDLGLRIETSGNQIKDDYITFVVRNAPDVFEVLP